MARKLNGIVLTATLFLSGAVLSYAQQHEQHSQPATPGTAPANEEMEHIFCPTMKTGQVFSHGTAATLKLQGEEVEAWVALARKYNRAVNAATEQLFTDAEAVLSAEQLGELKAWFAVGLNPQINDLLYAKGLGTKMSPASATAEEEQK